MDEQAELEEILAELLLLESQLNVQNICENDIYEFPRPPLFAVETNTRDSSEFTSTTLEYFERDSAFSDEISSAAPSLNNVPSVCLADRYIELTPQTTLNELKIPNQIAPLTTLPAAEDKEEKIRRALEKIKEASIKKVLVKAYSPDGSAKCILATESQQCHQICDILASKNHSSALASEIGPPSSNSINNCINNNNNNNNNNSSTNENFNNEGNKWWTLIEHLPDLHMERVIEDHEYLIQTTIDHWDITKTIDTSHTKKIRPSVNKILFLQTTEKYEPFEIFKLTYKPLSSYDHTNNNNNGSIVVQNFDNYIKNIGLIENKGQYETLLPRIFKDFLTHKMKDINHQPSTTNMGDFEDVIYIKASKKREWKKYHCYLRSSGLYMKPKRNKSKDNFSNLVCICKFDQVNVYYGFDWKKRYKAPTDFGFALKIPQVQISLSPHTKYFCVENSKLLSVWVNGIRLIKYGHQLLRNYVNFGLKVLTHHTPNGQNEPEFKVQYRSNQNINACPNISSPSKINDNSLNITNGYISPQKNRSIDIVSSKYLNTNKTFQNNNHLSNETSYPSTTYITTKAINKLQQPCIPLTGMPAILMAASCTNSNNNNNYYNNNNINNNNNNNNNNLFANNNNKYVSSNNINNNQIVDHNSNIVNNLNDYRSTAHQPFVNSNENYFQNHTSMHLKNSSTYNYKLLPKITNSDIVSPPQDLQCEDNLLSFPPPPPELLQPLSLYVDSKHDLCNLKALQHQNFSYASGQPKQSPTKLTTSSLPKPPPRNSNTQLSSF